MHAYWLARRLLLVVALVAGGGIAVWRGAIDYRVAVSETSPTPISIDAFQEYQGQRWLTVEKGVLVTDQVVLIPAPQGPGSAPDLVVFYLPMVARGWRPGDPVHVICKLGPGPRNKVDGWLKENGSGSLRSFTGVVANEPPGLYFPGLKLQEPVIVICEGGRPDGPEKALGVILLGVVMIVAGGVLGIWLFRRRNA